MIKQLDNVFVLETGSASYVMRILDSGHLEHLYYGRKITLRSVEDCELLFGMRKFTPGNTASYSQDHPELGLDRISQEISSLGKGDHGLPFVDASFADGSRTIDLLFEKAVIDRGEPDEDGLPHSYSEQDSNQPERLCISLLDEAGKLRLEITYYVYEDCDVITRSAKIINEASQPVHLSSLMSLQLDLPARTASDRNLMFTTFTGHWIREMQRNDLPVISGRYTNESILGTSSNRANPFCMLRAADSTERTGDVYGFNLIYSGNHRETVEVGTDRIRFMTGIHPQGFGWTLESGEAFAAPEAVMSFSHEGMNGLSQHMHDFVRQHIVRGKWRDKERPVLLNSWEACYMDISERKILRLAKTAKDVGVELMVMDDGWFKGRDTDFSSLGDWTPDKSKLPGGVDSLCKKVNQLGLDFGIWVEPEMVNVDSDLYRAHPDWALDIPGRAHSEGRNQRILDLSRPEVVDYIIKVMEELFSSANIAYVKWDMNRNFTDVYSKALPADRQDEVGHRYTLGLYRIMDTLTKEFPEILFEGCSSGGNRTDLGILAYFPQVWASDNTDAFCRAEIQNGYSYGYPMSVLGAHVSAVPNHQTLREVPLHVRYAVASFGLLGYECNLSEMSSEDRKAIAEQIALYKEWRSVYFSGRFYRGRRFDGALNGGQSGMPGALQEGLCDTMEWTVVSEDQSRAVGFIMQKHPLPNLAEQYYMPQGLDPDRKYHFMNLPHKLNIKAFGSLVNAVSPVHIKQNSMAHELLSRVMKMDGEQRELTAYGDAMMACGVRLHPAFASTGMDENVRLFGDFDTRLYYMEAADETE